MNQLELYKKLYHAYRRIGHDYSIIYSLTEDNEGEGRERENMEDALENASQYKVMIDMIEKHGSLSNALDAEHKEKEEQQSKEVEA